MKKLQKISGIAAVIEAFIYIIAFGYFGAFWAYPSSGTMPQKMAYLAEHQLTFSMIYFLMYAVFGILLAVIVVGLYERLKTAESSLLKVASVFGIVWVALVIASGMLATVGVAHAIKLMDQSVEQAFNLWQTLSVLIESLGGGNELVGGLWVLLLSLAAIPSAGLPRGLNYLGLIVGAFGIATVYPDELFTELFGITQIIWFSWLGIALLRQRDDNPKLKHASAQ